MKSNLEKVSSLERKLNIVVPVNEVQAAFDEAYRGVQKHAEIKGFRKGKVPLTTVRQMYGDRIKQDVIQNIVQSNYASAITEHSLDPVSYPAIEFDDISELSDFSFTAEFEVRPEVRAINWERLPVMREKIDIKSDLIEKTLDEIRKSHATTVPVFEDRPAQNGDVAVIDFKGHTLEGPLPNGEAQDHELELGTNQFIPGFEEGLLGLKPGQTKQLNLSFPENYQADLAGKAVTFDVTLKSLKKKQLPEMTDEFVKGLGGPYETVENLKNAISEDNEAREKRRIQEDVKNRLMRVLVERNPVEVPKSLLKEQQNSLVEEFKNRMTQQGMPENQFEDYKDKWAQDFEQTARFMIQSSFLIDALAREHKLYASAEDVEAKFKEYAAQTGIDVARVKDWYNEADRRSRLAYQITEEKVTEFLTSKAEIKEVSRQEIEAQEPKEEEATL